MKAFIYSMTAKFLFCLTEEFKDEYSPSILKAWSVHDAYLPDLL